MLKHYPDVFFSLHTTKSKFSHKKENGKNNNIKKYLFILLSIFIKIADLKSHNALQHGMFRACTSAGQTGVSICGMLEKTWKRGTVPL